MIKLIDKFTLEWETDEICQVYRNGECMSTDEVVDLLNEQQAEIMRLIIQLKCINQIKPSKKEIPDSIDIVISNDVELLQNLKDENKQLKQQLLYDGDDICGICKHEYLTPSGDYFIGKCEKGHEECSKEDIKYCEDFELKGEMNEV